MVMVNARYGFKEPRTRAIQRPDDPLYRVFGEWLEEFRNRDRPYNSYPVISLYENTLERIKDIEGIRKRTSRDINAMVASYRTHPKIDESGIFLSACYNLIEENDLVWDTETDTKISWIGYKLNETKRLILLADTGNQTGFDNKGILINCENTDGHIGAGSSGSAINFGKLDFMTPGGKGISINMGEIVGAMASSEEGYMASISFRNPEGLFCQGGPKVLNAIEPGGEICLDETSVKKHPRLVAHFEGFKKEMEQNPKNAFAVIDKYVGKTTDEFMQKLRGLLDSRTRRFTRFLGLEEKFYGDS